MDTRSHLIGRDISTTMCQSPFLFLGALCAGDDAVILAGQTKVVKKPSVRSSEVKLTYSKCVTVVGEIYSVFEKGKKFVRRSTRTSQVKIDLPHL